MKFELQFKVEDVVVGAFVRARKPKPSERTDEWWVGAFVRARGPERTDEWLGFTQLERQNASEKGVSYSTREMIPFLRWRTAS